MTNQSGATRCLLAALLLWAWLASPVTADGLPTTTLEVGGQVLDVEVAADPASKQRGLMYREHLADNGGMLFVWEYSGLRAMWMKNTRIPLDVAFVNRHYVITNIETMEPETETLHRSHRPVRFALETNAGWFERHGIRPGDRIPDIGRALERIH